jgi:hypothetical protein
VLEASVTGCDAAVRDSTVATVPVVRAVAVAGANRASPAPVRVRHPCIHPLHPGGRARWSLR